MHNGLATFSGANDGIVGIKRSDDIEPVFGKTAVAEKCAAEFSRADQNRVVCIALAKEILNIRDQPLAVVANLRPAAAADKGKILSDLHFTHL